MLPNWQTDTQMGSTLYPQPLMREGKIGFWQVFSSHTGKTFLTHEARHRVIIVIWYWENFGCVKPTGDVIAPLLVYFLLVSSVTRTPTQLQCLSVEARHLATCFNIYRSHSWSQLVGSENLPKNLLLCQRRKLVINGHYTQQLVRCSSVLFISVLLSM